MADLGKHIENQIEMLQSPKANSRYDACQNLAAAPAITPEAIKALQIALNDPDQSVVREAQRALRIHSSGSSTVIEKPAELKGITISEPSNKSTNALIIFAWIDLIASIIGGIGFWISIGGLTGFVAAVAVALQGIIGFTLFRVIASISENVIEIRNMLEKSK